MKEDDDEEEIRQELAGFVKATLPDLLLLMRGRSSGKWTPERRWAFETALSKVVPSRQRKDVKTHNLGTNVELSLENVIALARVPRSDHVPPALLASAKAAEAIFEEGEAQDASPNETAAPDAETRT